MEILDGIRWALAAYLVVLAGAAALGLHRGLLAYPFYAGYSLLRIGLRVVSFGRWRLAGARTFGSRQRRRLGVWIRDLREQSSEERASLLGEELEGPPAQWAAQKVDRPAGAGLELPQAEWADPDYVDPESKLPTMPGYGER